MGNRKGWVAAGDMEVGDKVYLYSCDSREIKELKFEHLDSPIKVYNFEVEDWHTYFVSEQDVFVHNSCGDKGAGGNNSLEAGNSRPPKNSTPNSIYEQLNPDGTVKSRAFYDATGNQFSRQDFDHAHFNKITQQYYQPHEHNYFYNSDGLPIGSSDGPLLPGYNNTRTKY